MRRWSPIKRLAFCALLVILGATVLSACGGERLDVNEPRASFTVAVPFRSFPGAQTLTQHSHLVLAVRNDSNRTIPNVAVTICNVTCRPRPGRSYDSLARAGEGTYAAPFAAGFQPMLASNSQAQGPPPTNFNGTQQIWIIDKPPDPSGCRGPGGYSCAGGAGGGAVTYANNTWALGPLKPGATRRFIWAVTAVRPGHWIVAWEISAGLSGKARAVLSNGAEPSGVFPVTISRTPSQSYVNQGGQIVSSPNGR